MKKLIASLVFVAASVFGISAANACNYNACAETVVTCANGAQIKTINAQANIAVTMCDGIKAKQITVPVTKKAKAPAKAVAQVVRTEASVSANWYSPRPKDRCAVGVPAPAFQDALLKKFDLTFTCDSQPNTGGWNLKQFGHKRPVYVSPAPGAKCVPRLPGAWTFACKVHVKAIADGGNALLVKAVWEANSRHPRTVYFRIYKVAGNMVSARLN